jgi:lysozyme family protein
LSDRKLKSLPPDPFRHQDSAIAPREHANPSNRRLRNLAKRPARPAYRNGRVQRMVERAIEALRLANTVEIMKWAYVERLHRGEGFERHHYRAALRALRQMGAVPIGEE